MYKNKNTTSLEKKDKKYQTSLVIRGIYIYIPLITFNNSLSTSKNTILHSFEKSFFGKHLLVLSATRVFFTSCGKGTFWLLERFLQKQAKGKQNLNITAKFPKK